MTLEAAGMGKATEYRIRKEANSNNNMLPSPKIIQYDDFTKSAFRRKHMNSFFAMHCLR
jgi:hypothetical protein